MAQEESVDALRNAVKQFSARRPPATPARKSGGFTLIELLVVIDRNFIKESNVSKPALTPLFVDSIWVDMSARPTDARATDLYNGSYSAATHDKLTGSMSTVSVTSSGSASAVEIFASD